MPGPYYANPCHAIGVAKVSTKRTRVTLPEDVVAGIDRLVCKRGRSAFLAEVAREEIQRRRQREALQAAAGSWKDRDHPELKGGSAAWVRKLRAASEARFRRIQQHRDRG
jgi:Arc/MetJ-type ribon-helix-helix transcriptional regulator